MRRVDGVAGRWRLIGLIRPWRRLRVDWLSIPIVPIVSTIVAIVVRVVECAADQAAYRGHSRADQPIDERAAHPREDDRADHRMLAPFVERVEIDRQRAHRAAEEGEADNGGHESADHGGDRTGKRARADRAGLAN